MQSRRCWGQVLSGVALSLLLGWQAAGETPDEDLIEKPPADAALLVDSLRQRLRELSAQLEATRRELDTTRAHLQQVRQENVALHEEASKKALAIKGLSESLAVAQTETELFRKKFEEQRVRLANLGVTTEGGTADSDRKLTKALRTLSELEAQQHELRSQLKRVVEIAEALLPAQVEGSQAALVRQRVVSELTKAREIAESGNTTDDSVPTGSLDEAQVVRVNEQLQLVVLNVGRAHGAQIGMVFAIVRNGRQIALVRVVDVRQQICGAVIADQRSMPASGDRAQMVVKPF